MLGLFENASVVGSAGDRRETGPSQAIPSMRAPMSELQRKTRFMTILSTPGHYLS